MKRILVVLLLITMGLGLAAPAGNDIVQVRALLDADGVRSGGQAKVAVVVDIKDGYHMNAHVPTFDYLIPTVVTFEKSPAITIGEFNYPPGEDFKLPGEDKPVSVYSHQLVLVAPIQVAAGTPPGGVTVKGVLSYQACDDTACLPPKKVPFELTVPVVAADAATKPANTEIKQFAAAAAPSPAATPQPEAENNDIARSIASAGWIWTFLGIFLAGLALNLTPCVYPLIPITISFFASQTSGREDAKGQATPHSAFPLAVAYVLGMAITYSLLGVAAASTGKLFGAAMQNPYVLAGVALIFFALSLSMFGVYELTVPASIASRVQSQKGLMGALSMGLFVGLVAAPCVGPFVVSLVTFVATTGSPVLGFWMFFTLAMGLGVPFLILGWFSGATSLLPRSGGWMVWVKKVMGLVMMGMGLYYLQTLIPPAIFQWVLPGFALLAFIWVGFFEKTTAKQPAFAVIKKSVGALGALAAVVMLANVAMAREGPSVVWQAALPEEAGKPVMIDFYADWCLDCRQLDKHVYTNPKIVDLSKQFVNVKVDRTRDESDTKAISDRFDVKGLPTIVFLDANGQEIKELRLTGFEEAPDFQKRMEKALQVTTAAR